MGTPLADLWNGFEDVCVEAREAFPDSPGHIVIARRWVMREPTSTAVHPCPACGQPRADGISLPRRYEVARVLGATSLAESAALAALGPQPGMGNRAVFNPWFAAARAIREQPLTDLEFRAADWTLPPRELAAFLREIGERWICASCAAAIAEMLTPASAALTPDRVFADLRRALEPALLARLESWRTTSTTPALARLRCGYCRAEGEGFVLPWFRMCGECASRAAAAAAGP